MTIPFSESDVVQVFKDYEIEMPALGYGSFKVAYKGRRASDDLVIKILMEPLPVDLDSTDSVPLPTRFSREIEGMSQINSPHVVRLVEAPRKCVIAGREYIWYAEPFYSGGTLESAISASRIGEELSRLVTVAMLQAVRSMWSDAAIVHRDIKPGNIVFDESGSPVLLDLGIAYHQSLSPLTDAYGASPRTNRYAAPEQFEMRRFAEIDFRTDLFQIGIVAFETLTGHHPFWHSSIEPSEYFRRLSSFAAKDMDAIDCSPDFKSVISRLLAPRPSQRYRTLALPLRGLGVTP